MNDNNVILPCISVLKFVFFFQLHRLLISMSYKNGIAKNLRKSKCSLRLILISASG